MNLFHLSSWPANAKLALVPTFPDKSALLRIRGSWSRSGHLEKEGEGDSTGGLGTPSEGRRTQTGRAAGSGFFTACGLC